MNRRGCLALVCVVGLTVAGSFVRIHASEIDVDPRRLMQVRDEHELETVLDDIETALTRAAQVGDRAFAASVYRVAEVAERSIDIWVPSATPSGLLGRLKELKRNAMEIGAPMIAEEVFAGIYEEFELAISILADAITGRQPAWTSKPITRRELAAFAQRCLVDARESVAEVERLFSYFPSGDAFAMQTYAYFLRKKTTAVWTIEKLELMADSLSW